MNKVSSLLGLSCIDTLFAIKKKNTKFITMMKIPLLKRYNVMPYNIIAV